MSLIIVDTGCANLSSVVFAFERIGVSAEITDVPERIMSAERVILPGVGSAPYAMAQIRRKNLVSVLQNVTQPMLGICLGMQILFESLSEGGGRIDGLGLVPGHVELLDTQGLPSPHMGWNTLDILRPHRLLKGLFSGDYAYFVHSYAAPIRVATLARTLYGTEFSAVIAHKNVYGCQFHPERSSRTGATILSNFMDLTA